MQDSQDTKELELVRGGQGRTAQEVLEEAFCFGFWLAIAAIVGVAYLGAYVF